MRATADVDTCCIWVNDVELTFLLPGGALFRWKDDMIGWREKKVDSAQIDQFPIRDQFSLEDPNHCHLCQERIRDRTKFLVGVETASAQSVASFNSHIYCGNT